MALQPYKGTKKVIVENQSTGDIIEGILDTHKRYKSDYDKIYHYFVGSSLMDTCNNIWQFLKDNVKYYIEPQKLQTLRSPAAILMKACDCKSYSLFANGILDAYRRNENKNFDICYRFAGYTKPKRIEHVFSVCTDKQGNEIWTDAVLNSFNDRFTIPVYYRDKKIENMALVAMAGVTQNQNWRNQGVSYESVGNISSVYYGKVGGSAISQYYEKMITKLGLRPDVYVLGTVKSPTDGFGKFSFNSAFANCNFDNSTYHWKCIRGQHLNGWNPIERMLWYLQGINSGEIPVEWLDTYADGYGHKPDSDKFSNDETVLPYNLVEVWNDTVKSLTSNPTNLSNWLINENITQGYNPADSIKKNNQQSIPGTTNKKSFLPLALAALAAKFLIFK